MATGALIDVTPDENGYDFVRDDGSSVYLLRTPETDELAGQISSLRSAGMIAQAPGGGDTATDMMSVAPAAPPPEMLATPNPGSADFGNAPLPGDVPPAAPPPMAPAGVPGAPLAAPAAPGAQAGIDPMQLAVLAARRQATPGVSQAQLQQKATQGVEMPSGTEVSVEGAVPYDQELAAQRAMATDMGREARVNQTIDERLALQQEGADAAELAQRIDAGINPARQKLQELERNVEDDARHYRSVRSQVLAGKVDPGRLFSGPVGAIAAIGATIGNALAAYGAIKGGSQNFAQQMIQAAIDRDVQAQVDEFNRLGAYADNTYAELMQRYQDRDMARAALEGMQLEYGKALATQRVARSKDTTAANNLQQWLAEDLFKEAELERQIREKSYGKHTEKMASRVEYPRAATGGGVDYQRLFNNVTKLSDEQRQAALADATIAEKRATAAKATAEAAGGGSDERKTYNNMVSSLDTAKAQVEAIAKAHGYEVDKKTGAFKQVGSGFPLSFDPTDGVFTGEDITKLQSDLTTFGIAYGRVVNEGGEPSADLARRMIPEVGPTSSPNNLKAQLESSYQYLLRREDSVKAGATPAVRARREQEKRNVNVERATSEGLPAPEEF